MPTVTIGAQDLSNKIGSLSNEEVENLCFKYGLELDEVTSEYEIVKREQGEEKAKGLSEDIIYKISIPANRYDILCVEGLTRALMIYENKMKTPHYSIKPSKANIIIKMTPGTQVVRPFVVAAVLKNLSFDAARYKSFMMLQDKLHQNIGKRRQIVSIGTHDLDTVKPPFLYTTKMPSDIKFIPLNDTKAYTAEELMVLYSKESHLKPYLSIIRDFEEYPIIYDSEGTVLSFPPIINSDHSKIKLSTKNVFIEITGTNLHKISVALDTMVTMFSEYCQDKFCIEPVEVHRPDGTVHQYPELSYRSENVSVEYINKIIGNNCTGEEIAKLLDRMSLSSEVIEGSNGSVLTVKVPPTRHDVLHRCDIAEDVAIAYGYDNIPEALPKVCTEGGDTPLNRLSDELRNVMVILGFTECLSFVLCSREDVSTKLGKLLVDVPAVQIANPKMPEFQVARTTLLPGILNTILSNQHNPLPLRLFEVQDVVLRDTSRDVGARNERHVCGIKYGNLPEFEQLYNDMTTVMESLGYSYDEDNRDDVSRKSYWCEEYADSMFMTGRSYRIMIAGRRDIGRVGVLLVKILANFSINMGLASMFEINIEPFL